MMASSKNCKIKSNPVNPGKHHQAEELVKLKGLHLCSRIVNMSLWRSGENPTASKQLWKICTRNIEVSNKWVSIATAAPPLFAAAGGTAPPPPLHCSQADHDTGAGALFSLVRPNDLSDDQLPSPYLICAILLVWIWMMFLLHLPCPSHFPQLICAIQLVWTRLMLHLPEKSGNEVSWRISWLIYLMMKTTA